MGVFTPLEGGGMGAFGAFIFALLRGRLTPKAFIQSLKETVEMSAMILLILTGAFILSYFLTMTQTPMRLASYIGTLPFSPLAIVGIILLFYIALGAIMDVFSAVVVTLPVTFPIVMAFGYDPVWFGLLVILVCELGLTTPPVALNLFVVSGIDREVPMSAIYRAVLPFVAVDTGVVLLICLFPEIFLFLPNFMK
jgi:tripartite ATP-independent transporter DctM subunit